MLACPAGAHASDHIADVFFAASFIRGSKLLGGHVSGAIAIGKEASGEHPTRHWSILGDLSLHVGSREEIDQTQVTFGAGPRYAIPVGERRRHHLFFQALLWGGQYTSDGPGGSDSSATVGAGVGYDLFWRRDRDIKKNLAIRCQVEYLFPLSSDVRSYPRLSLGLAWHKTPR